MAFVLPQFNLRCNVLHYPKVPGDVPDFDVECQLSVGEAHAIAHVTDDALVAYVHAMWLRLPFNTDIRSVNYGTREDYVEIPQWSGRWYRVASVDDFGPGFNNEHRFAIVIQYSWGLQPWPNARGPYFPPPPPTPPPATLGAFNTGGFPANVLPTTITVPAAGVVHALLCWEGGLLLAAPTALGIGPVFGTAQNQVLGLMQYNSVCMTTGPIPAGVYNFNYTFPMLGIGQIQVIYLFFPGAIGITNGINSAVGGGLIVSGTTMLTTIAPNTVILGGLAIGVTGPAVPFGPSVLAGVPQNEMVGGIPCTALMLSQPGAVNGVFTLSETGTAPANDSWWAFMAG